jgi:hypothetical protein
MAIANKKQDLKVEQMKKDGLSPDGKVDETIAVSFLNRTPTFGSYIIDGRVVFNAMGGYYMMI